MYPNWASPILMNVPDCTRTFAGMKKGLIWLCRSTTYATRICVNNEDKFTKPIKKQVKHTLIIKFLHEENSPMKNWQFHTQDPKIE